MHSTVLHRQILYVYTQRIEIQLFFNVCKMAFTHRLFCTQTGLLWARGRRGKTKGPCAGGTLCVLVRDNVETARLFEEKLKHRQHTIVFRETGIFGID